MSSPGIQSNTMMIREGFLLPDSAHLGSLGYSDRWPTLLDLDSFDLDRKLRAAGCHLFFIAGEWKVIALGWGAAAIRRGVQRILNSARKSHVNCLEITVASSRFMGFLKPDTLAEFTKTVENDIIPLLRKQPGFQDEITFALPAGNRVLAISLGGTQKNAENYDSSVYKDVLKLLGTVIDGTPKVGSTEVLHSTFPQTKADIPAA